MLQKVKAKAKSAAKFLLSTSSLGRNLLARRKLFLPCCSMFGFIAGGNVKRGAKEVYLPAFQKLFLLHSAYAENGMKGDILEFGVLLGYTSRLFAQLILDFRLTQTRLHLFDSFEGLPKNQGHDSASYEAVNQQWSEGVMAVPKEIPKLIEIKLWKMLGKERLFVVKGFFEKTLLCHLEKAQVRKASIVHLDCDLYSSTKCVLKILIEKEIFQEGTIVICDDWMCSFGNPNFGQKKALAEIEEEYPHWKFQKYLNYGFGSQAFVLHDTRIKVANRL